MRYRIRVAAVLLATAGGVLLLLALWPRSTGQPIVYGEASDCGDAACHGWSLRLASGEVYPLPYAAQEPEIAISDDGHRVVYLDLADRRVMARDLRDGTFRSLSPELTADQAVNIGGFVFSHDGGLVAYSAQSDSRIMDFGTGKVRTIAGICQVFGLSKDLIWGVPRCGPGSGENRRIVAIRADGSGFLVPGLDDEGVLLSPDGRRLLRVGIDYNEIVDAVTGKRLARMKSGGCERVERWLNDREVLCKRSKSYQAIDIARATSRTVTGVPARWGTGFVLGRVER
ncbi:hypothetical protein ACQP2T_42110 [Nonomuraea sp. CA-143628]|uniref:hypothetical protein n=1 Tax=Nonomuraea sp. CA-143628 TaxID=3239997 RepID=UPI003D8E1B60